MTDGGAGQLGLVALLAIVPVVVLMLTSFVKISVVLSLLRNALGASDAPSGLVIMGLSLVLTLFVMAPVAVEMVQAAAVPGPTPGLSPGHRGAPATPGPAPGRDSEEALAGRARAEGPPRSVSAETSGPTLELEAALRQLVPAAHHPQLDALARGLAPLRRFLARHAAERDRATFVELATRMGHAARADELRVLAPAFLTTELREAFAIAVLIFIPFLVIDLLVGLGLAALGLATTSPQVVALPFKLLLFVAVDGWRLLIDGLLRGYA